jgi:hypothetical protein
VEQQRDLPGQPVRRRRSRWGRPSTSRCAASGRCGTSSPGLHRRELAAYRLSEAMGIDLVPPTIIRDGPLGEGSLQWFVEADHQQHYFTIYENREELHAAAAVALFDVLANNTDRKSGHVLIDGDDHIWGIDHGLCFAAEFKLRTVVWEFGAALAGRLLPFRCCSVSRDSATPRSASEAPCGRRPRCPGRRCRRWGLPCPC